MVGMISAGYFQKLAGVESGNNPLAKNPKSSAKGRYQFIDATAKQYGITAPFGTPEYERQEERAVKKFTADNYNFLKQNIGREPTQGELYLAHQQGAQGAVNLISQKGKRAVDVLGRDEVINNGGNENMMVEEFASRWTAKFDDNEPVMQEGGELPRVNLYDLLDAKTGEIKVQNTALGERKNINLYDLLPNEQSDEFLEVKGQPQKQMIDSKSGAPSFVRAFVGSVYEPADRLSTLQQYYPDAQPYGKDNFLFTNPDNGKPTLYNPRGLDWGDVASISREAFVSAGSGVGAGAGILAGLPTGGAASIPLAMTGAGAGAAVSASAYDRIVNMLGLTVDTRSFNQKIVDYTIEGAAGAAGEGIGRAVAPLAKRALGGAKKTSKEIVDAFKSFGITPPLSPSINNRGAAVVEAGLNQIPSAASVMQKQTDEIIDQTQKAVSKITQSYGRPSSIQETGEVIKKAAVSAAERIGFRQETLYQEAYDKMGAGARVSVGNVKQLYQDMMQEVIRAPESIKPKLAPAMNELKAIIADAGDEGIDFQALRQVRTAIGQDLGKSFFTSGAEDAAKKRIYAAVSEDLASAASQVSPEAAKLIKRADRYTRVYETQYKQYLKKVIETNAEEKAYRYAMSSAQYGDTTLRKLKNLFEPEEWDMVAASVIDRLGLATNGMQNAQGDVFSVNTFLTNWNKLSPEAKNTLFNSKAHKETYQSLNKLADLMSKLKDAGRSGNTSNTAGALNTAVAVQALGGGLAGFAATGDVTGVVGTTVGTIIAPRYAAKLITNPKFVEWLASPVEQGVSSIPAHISRLVAIGEADDTMKEPIKEYLKSLDQVTKQDLQEQD